jgi:lysozyme family protein
VPCVSQWKESNRRYTALSISDSDFVTDVADVVGEEGGYTFNPADPGGETNWGISKRAFPDTDIKALTRDDAIALYKAHYWDPLVPYNLDPQFMRVAFECAVNQGLRKTTVLLAASKGQLSWFMAERALSYAADSGFSTFGRGWFRRLFREVTLT